MLLLLSLLLIIFGLLTLIFRNSCMSDIHAELGNVEINSSEKHYPTNFDYFVAKIIRVDETKENINYMITDGNSGFKLDEIQLVVKSAVQRGLPFGNAYGTVYYRTFNNNTKIACIDAKMIIESRDSLILNTATVFLISYILLFFIVYIFSSKFFEPIKESFYRQRKFISDASHELKTPIAVISANADVMKSQGQNEYVDSIKLQTERMKLLVSDMLMLSRIDEEKPTLKKEEFSLSDATIKNTLPFDAVAFERGKMIITDIQKDILVTEDIESYNKVLSILIDNAVKYANKNSTILVSLKKDGRQNVLTVFNEGSSVLDEDSNKIFDRFFRADNSRSRETGGCGLGLSIAKSICDLNKWKISAKSKFNKSMTITVII